MSNYLHGGDIYSYKHTQDLLDFSANISPLGLPNSVKSALVQSMDSWNRYPDPHCRELKNLLAEKHKTPDDFICCGNGAADLIFKAVQVLNPRCAMVTVPTFSEYRHALCSVGCMIIDFCLDEKSEFKLTETILTVLKKPLDLLVLCNPNNPTGQTIDPDLLEKILTVCAKNNIYVLLDECFVPFINNCEANSKISELEKFPNLLILRAFTKLYAMAGLRLGYLLCSDKTLIQKIDAYGQPWSVSTPAQTAGIAALKDTDYVDSVLRVIAVERIYLINAFKKLGLYVYGSDANYLFFKCRLTDLKEQLLAKNIFIRSCANFHGLNKQFYRISIRNHEDNQRLIDALTTIMMGEHV